MITFTYAWTINAFHWNFAFKYWVTAFEISRFFKYKEGNLKLKSNERCYQFTTFVVMLLNTVLCLTLGYKRGVLAVDEKEKIEGSYTKEVNVVLYLYYSVYSIQLFSGLIMVDALRRFKNTIASLSKVLSNRSTYNLYIIVVVCHCFIFILSIWIVFLYYK